MNVVIPYQNRTLEVNYTPLFEPADITHGPQAIDDYSLYIEQIIWIDGENRHDIFWAIDCESETFSIIYEAALAAALEEVAYV